MNIKSNRFEKQYRSSPDVSRVISDDMKVFSSELGVAIEIIDDMELCIVEIVNNAYEHAYQYKNDELIDFDCYLDKDGNFTFEVSDYGYSMTDEQFELAINNEFVEPLPEEPDTWHTSGRGFIIVEELTDNFEYLTTAQKNTFKFCKKVPSL